MGRALEDDEGLTREEAVALVAKLLQVAKGTAWNHLYRAQEAGKLPRSVVGQRGRGNRYVEQEVVAYCASLFCPPKLTKSWWSYETAVTELRLKVFATSSRRTAERYLRRVIQEEGIEVRTYFRRGKAQRGKGRKQRWIRQADLKKVIRRRRKEVLDELRALADAAGRDALELLRAAEKRGIRE